jgi:hypothetical protein
MRVYLGKQRNVTSTDVTLTYETILELFREVEGGVGHKIFVHSYFTTPIQFIIPGRRFA